MVADSPEAFNPDPPHLLATVCSFFSSSAIHFPARSGSSPSNHLRYTCSRITRRQRGFLHSGCEILDVTDAEQLEWLVTAEVAKDQPSDISQVCFWGPLGDLFISELILVFLVQHRAPGGKMLKYTVIYMYDPVLIAAILIMQVSQWTSPIIPGLQQTMFIPRESVSTSPSKTGSPGRAKPISSCQGIIGIHRQRCCIRSYQRISTARNCSSISIKHHQELLKLRGPLSCLMFLIIWLDQATSTLTKSYIELIIIYEASAYCSTEYESTNKRSLAIEMAVPAASPVIMTWVDTI